MSHRRHAKHSSHKTGTRDKGRNTMHNMYAESHTTDAANMHSHIRVIPAPDRHASNSSLDQSVPANSHAPTQTQLLLRRPASSTDPKQVTFASKLKAATQNENSPIAAPKSAGKKALVAGGAGAAKNSLAKQVSSAQGGAPSLDGSGRTAASAPKPSKLVFATRSSAHSLRASSNGNTAPSSTQQYGSQSQLAMDPQSDEDDDEGERVTVDAGGQNNFLDCSPGAGTVTQNEESSAIPSNVSEYRPEPSEDTGELTPTQYAHDNTMAPPGIRRTSRERQEEIDAVNEGRYGERLLGVQLPPPIDLSGRRGGISLPTVRPAPSLSENLPLGQGHQYGEPFQQASFGYQYADRFEQSCAPLWPTIIDGEGTEGDRMRRNHHFKPVNKELQEDRERLHRLSNRKSILHRLETLELCNRSSANYDINFTKDNHVNGFSWTLERDINHIDGTGPWGAHTPAGIRGSHFRAEFDLSFFEGGAKPMAYIDGNAKDPVYAELLKDWYDDGIVKVHILTEEEKDKLLEGTRLHRELAMPLPKAAVQNPTLLPYNASPSSKALDCEAGMTRLLNNLLEFKADSSASSGEKSYWQQIPGNDPGIRARSARLFFKGDNKKPKTPIEPTRRDFHGETIWLAAAYQRNHQMNSAPQYAMPASAVRRLPMQDDPQLRWSNVAPHQNDPHHWSSVALRQDDPHRWSNVAPRQDDPHRWSDVAPRQGDPYRWSSVAPRQEDDHHGTLQHPASDAQTPTPTRIKAQFPPGLADPASVGGHGKYQFGGMGMDGGMRMDGGVGMDGEPSEEDGSPRFSGASRKLFLSE